MLFSLLLIFSRNRFLHDAGKTIFQTMATIKQVAKKAEVSVVTVDRVLHDRGGYSKETEARVRNVVKALNYTPDIFARHLRMTKTFLFGVVMPHKRHNFDYWELPCRGINKARKELKSHKVKVKYYFYDRTSEHAFAGLETRIMREKPDGLLIAPNLWEQTREFCEKLPAQLPYIFFDTKIPRTGFLSYIGQNPYKSGVVAAKLMKLSLGGRPGTVAIINISPPDYHIEERIKGFFSFFRNNHGFRLKVYTMDTDRADAESHSLAARIIEEDGSVRGFFLPATPVFRFAEYLVLNRLKGTVSIIGYDLTRRNRKFLRNGGIDFIISQDPELQGYNGISLLYRHCVLKEAVPAEVLLPIDIITKENLPCY
jgi:LacI family transcriptional regulator